MATERDIFLEAARLTETGEPFVLVTVIGRKGSTPRDAGAKMIWRPGATGAGVTGAGGGTGGAGVVGQTGDLTGTVGGGQFEMLVAESAARVFAARGTAVEHYVLGAEAEQCCGGAMDVFFEYCGARQRLVIFGAGHVAKELVDVLGGGRGGSPFEIVVVDDRPEWNSPERFAPPTSIGVRRVLEWDEGVRIARERGGAAGETLACVMTCSHETDYELLRRLLQPSDQGAEGTRRESAAQERGGTPAFVGLIGSRSKRVCLFGRLIGAGIDEDVVKRVQCPIGVGNTGKEPRMVAVSMAAGLLLEGRKLEAARTAAVATVNGTRAAART